MKTARAGRAGRHRIAEVAVIAAVAALGSTPAGALPSPSEDAGLRAVRALTARYQSEAAAVRRLWSPGLSPGASYLLQ